MVSMEYKKSATLFDVYINGTEAPMYSILWNDGPKQRTTSKGKMLTALLPSKFY